MTNHTTFNGKELELGAVYKSLANNLLPDNLDNLPNTDAWQKTLSLELRYDKVFKWIQQAEQLKITWNNISVSLQLQTRLCTS